MHKLDRNKGNQLIRELGLSDFPDVDVDYFLMEGGVIAKVKSIFGGHELHIAFHDRTKVRQECDKLCSYFGGTWWAIIRSEKKSVVNAAKKIGFTYEGRFKGCSIADNVEREYVALKRG